MAILYCDQSFEIFDLEFDLENPIFSTDLSIFGQMILDFCFPSSARLSTSLQQLCPLFMDNRHRIFTLGPLALPNFCLSNEIMQEIAAISSQSAYLDHFKRFFEGSDSKIKAEQCLEFYGANGAPSLNVLAGMDYWPAWDGSVQARIQELRAIEILDFYVIGFKSLGNLIVIVHEGSLGTPNI